jgi:hypothetical protein
MNILLFTSRKRNLIPPLPDGYLFITDNNGVYLTDSFGNYFISLIPNLLTDSNGVYLTDENGNYLTY